MLDSTEITRDWYLKGLNFKLLQYLHEVKGLSVAVPASVVEEVVSNHDRARLQAERSFDRVAREYARLGLVAPVKPAPVGNYRSALLEVLDSQMIAILPWPDVSHRDLVARAVSRTPPFDANGSGYRDSLVWAAALMAAAPNPRVTYGSPPHVVLVSQDRIFSNNRGALAEALAGEAKEAGLSVELVRDLQAWIGSQLPQSQGVGLRDIAARARDARLEQYLMQSDFFHYLEVDPSNLNLPRSTGQVNVLENRGFDLEAVGFSKLDGGNTLVEYVLTVPTLIEADMAQEDAEANHWEWRSRSVLDRVWAEVSMELQGRLEVVYDAYDLDFDLSLGDLVQVGSSEEIVDVSGRGPVEPWNVPLPLFDVEAKVLGDGSSS